MSYLNRLIAATSILAVALAAIIIFWTVPTVRSINVLNGQIADARARLEFQYANRQVLRKILADLERLAADLPTLRSLAVPEGSELALVTAIEKRADERGLNHTLQISQPAEQKNATYDRELGVDLAVKGSFSSIAAFIEDLERLPQVFLSPRLSITVNREGGSELEARYHAAVSWPGVNGIKLQP